MERRLYSKEWTAGLLQSIYKVRSQQAVVELPPWSRLFTDRQLTCSRMSSHRMVSSLGPNAARSVADTLNDDNKHIIVQTYICMIKMYSQNWVVSLIYKHTLSTSRKTRKKLSPASFFKSSNVHIPLAINVENSSGYLDTSSKPAGALLKENGEMYIIYL